MVDILAIGAHPDDVELSCSGTLLKQIDAGYSVGLLDLCSGELGTRGTVKIRKKEAAEAALKLGAKFRWNAGLKDGFLFSNENNNKTVAAYIRKARPKIILANAPADRHPDHGRSADIAKEAFFLSGLKSLRLELDNNELESWRPKLLLHYIQDYHLVPDIVVDISSYMEMKLELIKVFRSQFYDPNSEEPETPISTKGFFEQLSGKAQTYGRYAGFEFGEGFISPRPLGLVDINVLI